MINIDKIKKELAGSNFVSGIFYFEEIDSTNTYAKNHEGEQLVITDYQTKGKGRLERAWHSEKGKNLTFSIKKTIDIPAEKISYVNYFFTYYTYKVIKELLNSSNKDTASLHIKWPNDILYAGKKICGILTESNLNKKEFTVGIGLNVNQKEFAPELNAASVYTISGKESDLNGLIIELVKIFENNFEGLHSTDIRLFNQWKESNNIIGKSAKLRLDSQPGIETKVLDLQEDGGITLQIKDEILTFYSGEIKITEILT